MMKIIKTLFFFLIIIWHTKINAQTYQTPISDNGKILTIKNWLVTQAIPSNYYLNEKEKIGLENSFAQDFLIAIGGERSPNIIVDKKFSAPNKKKYSFFQYNWQKDYLDITKLYGKPSDVFVYLYAEIISEVDQYVFLHVGTNDGGKVWVNGSLLINYPNGRSAEPSQNIASLDLKKGKNTILLKINQLGGEWGAYVQFYGITQQNIFDEVKKKLMDGSSKIAKIIETKVICKQPNRYIGWPTITKTKNGELLAVFSGNRDGHVCPFGIDQMIKSSDEGKTWSEALTINNTPLDDRDAGILELKSGTWLINWFTSMAFDTKDNYAKHPEWVRHREKLSQETINKWLGNWTRRSIDKGKTWETPVKQMVSSPHGPIELKNGNLLYVGTAEINGKKELAVEISKDDGKSWQLNATINKAKDDDINPYSEPHSVQLPDGKLITLFRYSPSGNENSYLRQSESLDGGKTWSRLRKTNVWGYPPHLLLLKNGWLLLSYGVRKIPYSERACISKDGGKTWDTNNEIILSFSESGDLGYPASVQLDDGSIVTIFYQIDKQGEKTSLMQTHWKLY